MKPVVRTALRCATLAMMPTLLPAQAMADPPRAEGQHFTIDPVSDIALTGSGAGITVLLSMILGTGEIRPSPLSPGDENKLLSIDRWAVNQTIEPNADTYSNVGLYTAVAFAVLDPVLSGLRDGWDAALVLERNPGIRRRIRNHGVSMKRLVRGYSDNMTAPTHRQRPTSTAGGARASIRGGRESHARQAPDVRCL